MVKPHQNAYLEGKKCQNIFCMSGNIIKTVKYKILLIYIYIYIYIHIESLLIAVHAFVSHVSMSFSVDEMLLPR